MRTASSVAARSSSRYSTDSEAEGSPCCIPGASMMRTSTTTEPSTTASMITRHAEMSSFCASALRSPSFHASFTSESVASIVSFTTRARVAGGAGGGGGAGDGGFGGGGFGFGGGGGGEGKRMNPVPPPLCVGGGGGDL